LSFLDSSYYDDDDDDDDDDNSCSRYCCPSLQLGCFIFAIFETVVQQSTCVGSYSQFLDSSPSIDFASQSSTLLVIVVVVFIVITNNIYQVLNSFNPSFFFSLLPSLPFRHFAATLGEKGLNVLQSIHSTIVFTCFKDDLENGSTLSKQFGNFKQHSSSAASFPNQPSNSPPQKRQAVQETLEQLQSRTLNAIYQIQRSQYFWKEDTANQSQHPESKRRNQFMQKSQEQLLILQSLSNTSPKYSSGTFATLKLSPLFAVLASIKKLHALVPFEQRLISGGLRTGILLYQD